MPGSYRSGYGHDQNYVRNLVSSINNYIFCQFYWLLGYLTFDEMVEVLSQTEFETLPIVTDEECSQVAKYLFYSYHEWKEDWAEYV